MPVAAAALNNNKIMFWASYDGFTFAQNSNGWTQTALFDIATNTAAEVQVSNTGHDMFCPGTAMLADGRVLVNGETGNFVSTGGGTGVVKSSLSRK